MSGSQLGPSQIDAENLSRWQCFPFPFRFRFRFGFRFRFVRFAFCLRNFSVIYVTYEEHNESAKRETDEIGLGERIKDEVPFGQRGRMKAVSAKGGAKRRRVDLLVDTSIVPP